MNKGTCQICKQIYAIRHGNIVHHKAAWHNGTCLGTGHPPKEVSNAKAEAYAEAAIEQAVHLLYHANAMRLCGEDYDGKMRVYHWSIPRDTAGECYTDAVAILAS